MHPTLLTILVAIGVLGILVFVHELGHFLMARAGGVRVLTFSLGFGPRVLGIRRGTTDYILSWIPFGGYVKMAGSPGETDEAEEEVPEAERFAAKPLGIRAAVIAAGPFMNWVLALLIFIGFFWIVGAETVKTRVVGRVVEESAAARAGIQRGDEILRIGTVDVATWMDLGKVLESRPSGDVPLLVRRGGEELRLSAALSGSADPPEPLGIFPLQTATVGGVRRGDVAHRAGLRPGDLILSLGGTAVGSWDELVDLIRNSAGLELEVRWLREGREMSAALIPQEGDVPDGDSGTRRGGLIGISPHFDREPLGFSRAVVAGWTQTAWLCEQILDSLGKLVRFKVNKDEVGGPLRIGEMAGEQFRWGWDRLLNFIAVMSVHLALLNLLPIPILDGGQLLIMLPEAVTRRPLSLRQRLVLQNIGFALVLLLMAVVTVLDVGRLIQR